MTQTQPEREADGAEVIEFPAQARPALEAVPATTAPAEVSEVIEGEVVEEGAAAGAQLVDDPAAPAGTGWMADRRAYLADAPPIVPSYLRDREEFAEAARFVAAYYAHVAAFHATRSPLYMLRLMARSPRGAARLVGRWLAWLNDVEAKPVMAKAAAKGDPQAWMQLVSTQTRRTKARRNASLIVGVPTAAAVVAAVVLLPGWAVGVGVVALLNALGMVGRVADRPVITRFTSEAVARKVDSDEITAAMRALGILAKGAALDFASPIHRDGPGWRVEIDLPRGVLATKVIEKRAELAGAMRRPVATVWPEGDREAHPGRLVLWVAAHDPAKAKRKLWPLMHEGQADIFGPLPLGFDPRGRQVDIELMYSNLLIGGIPGSGKTSAVLAILLGVALDPTVRLWVYELKGSGDLDSVRPVCHRYVSGDDDVHVKTTVEGLRAALIEQKRRAKVISELPLEDVSEGRKVTRAMAAKYPSQGLEPMVVVVDEAQELFTHGKYGKEAADLCKRLIKKGRAYGIILILATQNPDADSLPTAVSSNVGRRFCLAVMDWRANNNVLGTGAHERGLRATEIAPTEQGTGILARGREGVTVRAAFIKQEEAQAIGRRALALRTAAGTLSGEAAGQEVTSVDTTTIIDHLRAVWPDGEDRMHSVRLVEALAAFRPDLYGTWTEQDETTQAKTLAAAVKPFGVPTGQVNKRGDGGNRKGIRFADLPEEAPDAFDLEDEDEDDEEDEE